MHGKGKVHVYIEITRYSGSKYYRRVYLPTEELSNVLGESLNDFSLGKNVVINGRYFELTKEEEESVKAELNESLKNMKNKILFDLVYNDSNISLYEYKNHELVRLNYPMNINNKVANILMNAYNRYANEYVKTGYSLYYYNIDFGENVSDEIQEKMNMALNYCNESVISDFILDNFNTDEKELSKCAIIYSNKFRFYTEKVDELLKVLAKVYEANKGNIDNEYKIYYEPKKEEIIYEYETEETRAQVVEIID